MLSRLCRAVEVAKPRARTACSAGLTVEMASLGMVGDVWLNSTPRPDRRPPEYLPIYTPSPVRARNVRSSGICFRITPPRIFGTAQLVFHLGCFLFSFPWLLLFGNDTRPWAESCLFVQRSQHGFLPALHLERKRRHPHPMRQVPHPPRRRHTAHNPTGTFTSIYLYILQFSTLTRQLTIQSRVPAHGAHQYLALSPGRDTLYATSWAWPPSLYSFHVATAPVEEDQAPTVELTYQGKTPISESSRGRKNRF